MYWVQWMLSTLLLAHGAVDALQSSFVPTTNKRRQHTVSLSRFMYQAQQQSRRHNKCYSSIQMRDRSCSNAFQVGDRVKAIESVMKGGVDLMGFTGMVAELWSKCEVDPTCCCAEQVGLNMAVLVKFDGSVPGGKNVPSGKSFTHYFGEDELEKSIISSEKQDDKDAPFDGLSCKAFKLKQLDMGGQAQRLKAFKENASEK